MALTLVLLPGLDGTEVFFEPLLKRLPAWITPLVITYPAAGDNGYAALLAMVERRVAMLGEFAVLGWSFGGPLALMLAAARPSQVSALILCNSYLTPPRPRLARWRPVLVAPLIALLRTLRRTRYYLIPGYASSPLRRAKAVTWRRVHAPALAARARAALAVDVRAWFAQCRCRMLCLAAAQDEVIPRRCFDEMQALAPPATGAVFETLAGRHMMLFTHAAESAAAITSFLQPQTGGRNKADAVAPHDVTGLTNCRTATHKTVGP